MNLKKALLVLVSSVVMTFTAVAQIKFSPIFTDNMVVQQQAEVVVWGTSAPNESINISVTWNSVEVKTIANSSGHWQATMQTPKADGKAHTITANGVVLSNVALGEVWLASGQSNMEWCVNHGILDGENEAKNATNPNIRIFYVSKVADETPQRYMDAKWEVSSPESMRRASAVAYFFARKLQKELNVPVGIISSAWGGTPAEPWIPSDAFSKSGFDVNNIVSNENPWWPIKVGTAYNSMIAPLVPFKLAGAIWYQGESNRNKAPYYNQLMKILIEGWREKFKSDFPFYFVQIAPFAYGDFIEETAFLRQQQELTAKEVPNTGMIVISDKVDDVKNIHPKDKQTVGLRLANYALAETYHRTDITSYRSPSASTVKILKNGHISITFNDAKNGLKCTGKEIVGLKISDANGVFYKAEGKINGSEIEVWAKEVKKPVSASYCFDSATIGNLFSTEGLPVASFRL